MIPQTDKDFIAYAYQQLIARGWLSEADLRPSSITEADIAAFEGRFQVTLPPLYKAFLTAWRFPLDAISAIADSGGELAPVWLTLYGYPSMDALAEEMDVLREDAEEFRALSRENFRQLIPIGDWYAGAGPLCIDLTRPEDDADADGEDTWSLVWFDHEAVWGDRAAPDENGLVHGSPAVPNFKTLLEWYFCGALEPEFEAENEVKVTAARLRSSVFCRSWWEDRWKQPPTDASL